MLSRVGFDRAPVSDRNSFMAISLTPDQHAWIDARVASGDFASIEAGVRQLLDERITELSIQEDDLAWAKPYVDEALAEVARGEVMTREEHRSRVIALLASFKD
jgi:antitoxin ParD1/3/4